MAGKARGEAKALPLKKDRGPWEEPNITELTAIARIKPGMAKKFKALLEKAHKTRQNAIRKMATIHNARWVILDEDLLPGIDGPHVLFSVNYDGLLEGYLEEFATVDEGPLNQAFSEAVGWPRARPIKNFIEYVKAHQHPASLFYANYPRATVGYVNRAMQWKEKTDNFIKILEGLPKDKPEQWQAATQKFLKDLSKPTPKKEQFPKKP